MSRKYVVVAHQKTHQFPQRHGPFDTRVEADRYAGRLVSSKEYRDGVVVVPATAKDCEPPAALKGMFRL